jgi:hypothetical protein
MPRSPRKLSPALDTPLLGRGPSPSTASQLLSPMARAATWSVVASRGQWRSRAAPTIAWTTSRLTLRARGPGRCRRRRSAPGRCQAGRAARQGSGSRRRQVPLRRARTCPETPPRTTCTTHGQPTGGVPPAATETRAGCTELLATEARMCHTALDMGTARVGAYGTRVSSTFFLSFETVGKKTAAVYYPGEYLVNIV